jgi:hypothetical protein
VIAAQLGVSERTVRRRASEEGWRRRDQPMAAVDMPACLVDWAPDDPNSPLNQFSAATDREIAELLIDPVLPVYLSHASAARQNPPPWVGWSRPSTGRT